MDQDAKFAAALDPETKRRIEEFSKVDRGLRLRPLREDLRDAWSEFWKKFVEIFRLW